MGDASRNFQRGYNTKSLIQSTRSKRNFCSFVFLEFQGIYFCTQTIHCVWHNLNIVYVFIHVWNKQNKYKYMVCEMRNLVFDISANFLYFLTSVAVMVNLLISEIGQTHSNNSSSISLTNCLSVSNHFVELILKWLKSHAQIIDEV